MEITVGVLIWFCVYFKGRPRDRWEVKVKTVAKTALMDSWGRNMEADYQPQEVRRERHGMVFSLEQTNTVEALVWNFWLIGCEKIHLYCFKLSRLWQFIIVRWETNKVCYPPVPFLIMP